MKRQTRKQLKTDEFAQGFGETFSFLNQHRAESIRYGAIALAVIILGAGYYVYSRHQATVRETALAQALRVADAVIGTADTPTNKAFPTQEAKDQARKNAFLDLWTKYHGTAEGSVGGMYVASDLADSGKYADAEKIYVDVVDSAPKVYVPAAQLALVGVYRAENKTQDAEKLLRDIIAHPSELISSDSAKLDLADLLAQSNPKEALALAEPLRQSDHVAVSKEAINVVGRINSTAHK